MTVATQPGTILDRAQPAATIGAGTGNVWIIYGKAGVGKTRLAATAGDVPGGGPVLFISTDKSVRSITHRTDALVLVPESWEDLGAIYRALFTQSPYRTIVLDTLSEAVALCQEAVLRESKHTSLTMDDYAAFNKRVIALICRFRDLGHDRGLTVILTAWELEKDVEDDGRKFARIQPDFSTGVMLFAPAAVDGLFRLSIVRAADGTTRRMLTLTSQPTTATKSRVPEGIVVPERLADPTIPALLAVLNPAPAPVDPLAPAPVGLLPPKEVR